MIKSDFIKDVVNESNIMPYNGGNVEQADQYSENENFVKNFYTTLSGSEVEWSNSKIPDPDYNLFFDGKINIDWGVTCIIKNNTFQAKSVIRSVSGMLDLYYYKGNQKVNKEYPFSSKGYKIEGDIQNIEGVFAITQIEIDMDAKVIKLSNY